MADPARLDPATEATRRGWTHEVSAPHPPVAAGWMALTLVVILPAR